jgi:ribonucleoside-diphosphate reductase alpha chain
MGVAKCANNGLTDEPRLTENARKVLEARYLKKNEHGQCLEAPADLFRRVATTIADVELGYGATDAVRQQWQHRFYDIMARGEFMPNSPTLMNAGREMGMLSACFVLPVRDSITDIFNSIKHTALIQKAGGGTGFAFDELRPTGDFIKSSGGTTSGPISFWRAFSEATNAIQQGAFRRGANMGMMYIHHPDILKFLHAKQDLSQFTNYNISVKVTDDWMNEFDADADSPHIVRNPRNGKAFVIPKDTEIWKYGVRDLVEVDCVEPIHPDSSETYFRSPRQTAPLPESLRGNVYTKREIWNIIIDNAWQTGEPGVVFIDRINENNPTPHIGRIEATNPCGEQPLLPYEACNLGSINLGAFVIQHDNGRADVDWDGLRDVVHVATRFLDNVIDANNYPLDEIARICRDNRKIGLGVMGFADALYKLGVPYNTDDGIAWGRRFMKFLNDEAHSCSESLARERGCFPNWQGSIWQTRHSRMMRNSAVTTVAPTGTISIIANCSGGIEPMFSLAFVRNVLRGQLKDEKPLVEVNGIFRTVAEERGLLADDLLERIAHEGTLAHIDAIPEDIKRVFVCAHDITPEWHMKMQAAFQDHCDASISKTINFPTEASRDHVEQIYRLAFSLRCKGVTVYRNGCRSFQPMALKEKESKEKQAKATQQQARAAEPNPPATAAPQPEPVTTPASASTPHPDSAVRDRSAAAASPVPAADPIRADRPGIKLPPRIEPMDLPEIVSGLRIRQMTPFGNMHVKITVDPRSNRELEVFAQLGKGGDVANSDLEGLCRMVSLWLRSGGSLRRVIKQLDGIGSSMQIPTRTGRITSLPDGLACALKKYERAKERFGLHALLLGQIDLAELDRPIPPPAHHRGSATMDHPPVWHGRPARDGEHGHPARDSESMWHRRPAGDGEHGRPARESNDNGGNGGNGNGGHGHPAGNGGHSHPAHESNADTQQPATTTTAKVAATPAPHTAERTTTQPTAVWHRRPAGDGEHGHPARESEASGNGNGNDVAVATADPAADADVVTDVASDPIDVPAVARRVEASALSSPATARPTSAAAGAKSVAITASHATSPVKPVAPLRHGHDVASGYKVVCPECHAVLMLQEGCRKCSNPGCGWSAC